MQSENKALKMESFSEVLNNEPCRLCLNVPDIKMNIFTDDFAKMIEILTSLKIKPDDDLPKISCLNCARSVKHAFLFRRQIIQSNKILMNKAALITHRPPILSSIRSLQTTSPPNSVQPHNEEENRTETSELLEAVLNCPTEEPKESSETFSCKICRMEFASKAVYKNHLTKHKHKTCPVCCKLIRTVYFPKHLRLHQDAPVLCELCGASCKNRNSLRMHHFYNHKSSASVCEDCGKSFRSKTRLFYHRQKDHTNERNYKCETCGKAFVQKAYLTKHIETKHLKLRPNICEYCGKGFSKGHALRTHLRQHTNEAPYKCNLCANRFKQKVSLRSHMKNHHKIEEENIVFCETCGKGFATDVALEVHTRKHESIKCPLCPDTFGSRQYLEQHLTDVHPRVQCMDEEA